MSQNRKSTHIPTLLVLVPLIVVLPYVNSLGNRFIWDDSIQLIRLGIGIQPSSTVLLESGAWRMDPLDEDFAQDQKDAVKKIQPLLVLSFLFDAHIWENEPFGYHLTNVLLFYAVVFVLLAVGFAVTPRRWAVCLGVLFWASNPIHADTVSRISGRANELVALWLALAALSVCAAGRRQGRLRLWLLSCSAFFFLLGLLSHQIAVLFAFVLFVLLTDFRDRLVFTVKERQVFGGVVLSAVIVYVGFYLLSGSPADAAGIIDSAVSSVFAAPMVLLQYIGYVFYLPHLTMHFEQPNAAATISWRFVVPLVVHSGIWALALHWRRYSRIPWLGVLFFYLFMVPGVLTAVGSAEHTLSSLFCSSVGVTMVCTYVVVAAWDRCSRSIRTLLAIGVVGVVMVNGLRVMDRNADFHDNEAFYISIVRDMPGSAVGYCGLGDTYLRQRRIANAVLAYKRAIKTDPLCNRAYNNLAIVLLRSGYLEYARAVVEAGLIQNPHSDKLHYNMGLIHQQEGRLEAALKSFQSAVKENRRHAKACREIYRIYLETDPAKAAAFKREHDDKM